MVSTVGCAAQSIAHPRLLVWGTLCLALAQGLVHHCAHDKLPEVLVPPVAAVQGYAGIDAG